MTEYKTLAQQVADELHKLEQIKNYVISLNRGLIYPERFAMLVKATIEREEVDDDETRTKSAS